MPIVVRKPMTAAPDPVQLGVTRCLLSFTLRSTAGSRNVDVTYAIDPGANVDFASMIPRSRSGTPDPNNQFPDDSFRLLGVRVNGDEVVEVEVVFEKRGARNVANGFEVSALSVNGREQDRTSCMVTRT